MATAITLLATAIILTNVGVWSNAARIRKLESHRLDILICLATIIHKVERLDKANKNAKKSTKKEK